ncbi:MAG: indolepyruvate oxidoreductase subunit beta [Lachnospiraceae bacterium]|nr:indolepyruvate oxidoreductase subunit beta [Lachnospiraceae bacterium]
MKSLLLCGVGGQGTVLASRILAQAAMEEGKFARTAETIGMAQRGGCVVSHVRIDSKDCSPLVPLKKADILIAFEPGEAVRNLPYLKPEGIVIVCDNPICPVTASLAGIEYDSRKMIDYIKSKVDRVIVVDGNKICEECGSSKVVNVALVGTIIKTGAAELSEESVKKVLKDKLKPEFLDMNMKALSLGMEYTI